MAMKYAENLLNEFSKIKLMPKRRETFMSISGYPHYENVVSNILKFFFEDNEHNMKNLWIRSLLENVPNLKNTDFQNVVVEEVYREYVTKKNKRIDIVVVCDNYIISIENKIFAPVNNDLKEYADTIKTINKIDYNGMKEEVNIVLSLKPVPLGNKPKSIKSLCNITYDMILNKVKENVDNYRTQADNDWLIKMNDFIYTIEGLIEDSLIDDQIIDFLNKNSKDVERMLDVICKYRQRIKNEVKGLARELSQNQKFKNLKRNKFKNCAVKAPYPYYGNDPESRLFSSVVVDIDINDKTLTLETYPDGKNWHVVLWVRKGNKGALKSILQNNNIVVLENLDAKTWWNGCEIACAPMIKDSYQEVIAKIVNDGLDAAEKVLNSNNW